MKIEEQSLEAHSKANGMLVAKYASQSSKHIDLLIGLVSQEVVYQQRATQALAYAVAHLKVKLSEVQLNKLINLLKIENIHNAVPRGVLKILELQNSLPEISEGFLFEFCTTNIMNPQKAIAVRVFSLPVAYKIALKYPDLQNELRQILEGLSPNEGPGMRFRKTKYLKLLRD
jgi:hypothetical protein